MEFSGFKITRNDEIICYCAGITTDEIRRAVTAGCHTIATVRDFLNKHQSGMCARTSPDGKCCHKRFEAIIRQSINNNQ